MPTYKIETLKTGEPLVADPDNFGGKTEWEGREFCAWDNSGEGEKEEFASDDDAIAYGKDRAPKSKHSYRGGMFKVSVRKDGQFVLVEGCDPPESREPGKFYCK